MTGSSARKSFIKNARLIQFGSACSSQTNLVLDSSHVEIFLARLNGDKHTHVKISQRLGS